MIRESNLFHNLVVNENTLTELLANLLQIQPFRDRFASLIIKKTGFSDFSFRYKDVQTQRTLPGLGRPDLVIENESFCILIECKVEDDRELTPHQQANYLRYLEKQTNQKCALLFLVPLYYAHEASIYPVISSKVQSRVIYWNELTSYLEQLPIADKNIALDHFIALLHNWFDPIFFSEEEKMLMQNKEFPALLLNLMDLTRVIQPKISKPFKARYLLNEGGFGCYVKNSKNQDLLWFGCDYEFWRDRGHCFVIGVGDDEGENFSPAVINRFRERFEGEAISYAPEPEDGPWYIVPIPESLIEDPHKLGDLVYFIVDAAKFCDYPKMRR